MYDNYKWVISASRAGSVFPNLKEGVDIDLAQLSCISLMICPFLLPDTAFKLMNMERNEASLMALLEHNVKLLEQGILKQSEEDL